MVSTVKTIPKVNINTLAKSAILLSVAVFTPMVFHIQWVAGPIVNATLFLAVVLVGSRNALLIGIIPSAAALSSGLLPALLAPMVPFIMISNAILIIIFDWLRKSGYWQGVIIAALAKFLFLYFSTATITNLIFKEELALKVSQMLSWPQFFTAVLGGVMAWGILKHGTWNIKHGTEI